MTETEQRIELIVLLYRSIFDYDFQPETSTGAIVRKQADPRGRNEKRAPCEACAAWGASGFIRKRGIPYGCVACGGKDEPVSAISQRGWGRGYVVVDGYTQRPIGSEDGGLVDGRRWVLCDSCRGGGNGRAPGVHGNGQTCRICCESGRPGYVLAPAHTIRFVVGSLQVDVEPITEGDPVFRALEVRRRAGSFEELLAATRELRVRWEDGYRLIAGTYVEGRREPGELPEKLRRHLDVALHFVERLMPAEIHVPPGARRAERLRLERVAQRRRGIAA